MPRLPATQNNLDQGPGARTPFDASMDVYLKSGPCHFKDNRFDVPFSSLGEIGPMAFANER